MDSHTDFLAAFEAVFIELMPSRNVLLAFSGGMDSHVLLDALCQLRDNGFSLNIRATYVNHHLQTASEAWGVHCARVCSQLQVPFCAVDVSIPKTPGESCEALARSARYDALKAQMKPGETLLTAHHLDDQAETVLLQLLRGAGLKGLSGVALRSSFGQGFLARPLLSFSRESLLRYASARSLEWVEDETNQSPIFRRNYLRHNVMPLLQKLWPSMQTTLARSARHCGEAERLLDAYVQQDLDALFDARSQSLCLCSLTAFSRERQRAILRAFLKRLDCSMPSAIKLDHVLTDVIAAGPDAAPLLEWEGVEVRRYQNRLFAFAPLPAHDASAIYAWPSSGELVLPNIGKLTLEPSSGGVQLDAARQLSIRFRQGGESLQLDGRGSRSLKKLFQEWQVYPWMRERVPLLYVDDNLAAVVGHAIDQRFITKEQGVTLRLAE